MSVIFAKRIIKNSFEEYCREYCKRLSLKSVVNNIFKQFLKDAFITLNEYFLTCSNYLLETCLKIHQTFHRNSSH